MTDVDLPDAAAGTTTNVVHWLTGIGYGIGHGLLRNGRGTLTSGLATSAAYTLLSSRGDISFAA